jgi:hypothetical protein
MKIKVNSARETTTATSQGSRNKLAGMFLAPSADAA